MDDLAQFCCQNSECADYGKRSAGNLTVCDRYGKNQQRRVLRCRTCKDRFSERKGTVFFGAQLPEEKVVAVLAHVAEGCGVRKTSRLLHVNRSTVSRYSALAGQHARQLHEERVAFSPEHPGTAVRREVGVRRQEGEALRPRQPGRRPAR